MEEHEERKEKRKEEKKDFQMLGGVKGTTCVDRNGLDFTGKKFPSHSQGLRTVVMCVSIINHWYKLCTANVTDNSRASEGLFTPENAFTNEGCL